MCDPMIMKLPIKTKWLYITKFEDSMAEIVQINSLDEDNRRFVPDEVFETVEQARETLSRSHLVLLPKRQAPCLSGCSA